VPPRCIYNINARSTTAALNSLDAGMFKSVCEVVGSQPRLRNSGGREVQRSRPLKYFHGL
jgi:hypothetical protein